MDNVRVPSYVNGKGQFRVDLPDKPIVNLFSMNFSLSLWSNITSSVMVPDNVTSFLQHLSDHSDIKKYALDLKTFNATIQHYETLQHQLPSYHPFVWASQPEGQITGFIVLLLLNIVTSMMIVRALWKLRWRLNALTQAQQASPSEQRPLVRVRRRIRQAPDQVV